MPAVLNTSLFLPFGKRGVTRDAAEASFVQDLICYETVWVLTDQLSAVPRLIEIMGLQAFETAISEGALRFVHDRHLLVWPSFPGYQGVVPFQAIASLPSAENLNGYTQQSTRDRATTLLTPYIPCFRHTRTLATKIEQATHEFGGVLGLPPTRTDDTVSNLLRDIEVYEAAVAMLPDFPLKPRDLIQLRRDLRDPRRSPMRPHGGQTTYKAVTMQQTSGPESLSPEAQIPRKQLGMLNLALADRFLAVHASLEQVHTLHSEPIVEQILAARLASVRRAAAGEINIVLDAAQVYLPVLKRAGEFPYPELLRARTSRAAGAFREVVGRRDAHPTRELIQEYYTEIGKPIANRFGFALARFLTTSIAGVLHPGLGLLASTADTFGVPWISSKKDARFFVDTQLGRIGRQEH